MCIPQTGGGNEEGSRPIYSSIKQASYFTHLRSVTRRRTYRIYSSFKPILKLLILSGAILHPCEVFRGGSKRILCSIQHILKQFLFSGATRHARRKKTRIYIKDRLGQPGFRGGIETPRRKEQELCDLFWLEIENSHCVMRE